MKFPFKFRSLINKRVKIYLLIIHHAKESSSISIIVL